MNPWCRPAAQEKQERPTIVLLLGCGRDEKVALAVGAGCEEEGVPVIWERDDGTADELARKAAQRSRLEVGIGFDEKKGAVTFAKYPSPRAYLTVEIEGLEKARWLGQAAACFVKSKPLPEEPARVPGSLSEKPLSGDQPSSSRQTNGESGQAAVTATQNETTEVVVDRIARAVMEALRRQS